MDCTAPGGWKRLRDLLGHPDSPVVALILARVLPVSGSSVSWGDDPARAALEALCLDASPAVAAVARERLASAPSS